VGGELDGVRDVSRALERSPLFDLQELEVEWSAEIFKLARHSLGRPFRHCILTGVSTVPTDAIVASTPSSVRAAGYDPAVYVILGTPSAFTGTTTWLVA
jgi:hypothetical protein